MGVGYLRLAMERWYTPQFHGDFVTVSGFFHQIAALVLATRDCWTIAIWISISAEAREEHEL